MSRTGGEGIVDARTNDDRAAPPDSTPEPDPDPSWAIDLLRDHDVLTTTAGVTAQALTGGVSSDIVTVHRGDGPDLVVKRALRWLNVPSPWESDPGRIHTEAAGLRLAGTTCPGGCPPVVLVDRPTHTLVMHAAPRGWRPWKQRLFAGDIADAVARRLGAFLGRLHGATAGDADVRHRFEDLTHLRDLRIDAFYHAAARRHPHVAAEVRARARHLLADRRCFVHGDFSPKNVLVGDEGAWVVDFEVAHYGSPQFDLAYMLHHLVMKSVHQPDHATRLLRVAGTLVEAYRDAGGLVTDAETADVTAHIGCLLLARVDGKSPSGYLRADAEAHIREQAPALIRDPVASLTGLWEHMTRG